jgi:hypothetical protein
MAAHKGPASSRPRCTQGGSSVAAIPVYHFTLHIRLKLCKDKGKAVPLHVMKVDGRVKVQLHTFITLQPVGGQHSASHPSDITPPTVMTIFRIKKFLVLLVIKPQVLNRYFRSNSIVETKFRNFQYFTLR